ncbi:MAG TPA: hypothetical protein DEV93_00590 [Chloroflexi bacterium]|nr:hypothetical protein [Chloroflexota bacterium]
MLGLRGKTVPTGKLVAGSRWKDTGLVFTTPIGTPLDGSNVTKSFQKLLARAGLPKRRFHDLRHSCATLLLVQNVAPRVVMEILGHSQISLTMNTYSHVLPGRGCQPDGQAPDRRLGARGLARRAGLGADLSQRVVVPLLRLHDGGSLALVPPVWPVALAGRRASSRLRDVAALDHFSQARTDFRSQPVIAEPVAHFS